MKEFIFEMNLRGNKRNYFEHNIIKYWLKDDQSEAFYYIFDKFTNS